MLRIIYIFLCASIYVVLAENDPPVLSHEMQCVAQGGICVKAQECSQENISKIKGLCPIQQKNGVVCCNGIPKSKTKCIQRGGICFPKSYTCPESLTFSAATDCASEEKCCILVN